MGTETAIKEQQDTREYLGGNGVKFEPAPVGDQWAFTPADKKTYGLKDNFTPSWPRNSISNPKWKEHDPNRVSDILHQYPGAYILQDEDGNMCHRGDNICVAIPTAMIEDRERQVVENGVKPYIDEIHPSDQGHHAGQFDRRNEERIMEMTRINSERMRADHMVGDGSPTYGMSLTDALRTRTKEQVVAENERYRRGNRSTSLTDEQYEQIMLPQPKQGRGSANAGKFTSIPSNVRSKNHAGAKKG